MKQVKFTYNDAIYENYYDYFNNFGLSSFKVSSCTIDYTNIESSILRLYLSDYFICRFVNNKNKQL